MRTRTRYAVITAVAITLFYWLVSVYEAALRDPRFLDGWILVAGIGGQLMFHLRKKSTTLPLGKTADWLRVHIFIGYFVIAVFLSHTSFSTPEQLVEWVLWCIFVLVAASGIVGAYLSWAIPTKLERRDEPIAFERIPAFQSMLAKQAGCAGHRLRQSRRVTGAFGALFGQAPCYFNRPQNLFAHLRGSKRPLRQICDEIEAVERYVDDAGATLLRKVRDLVIEKDALDSHYAHQGALQIWLFIHIPATYSMIVVTVLHVATIYAFSSSVP